MLSSANFLIISSHFPFLLSNSNEFPILTTTNHFSLSICSAQQKQCITQLSQQPEQGPIELPSNSNDDPNLLQTATSVLLTGSISIFLFRSLRKRANRAKELKFRSSGVNKKKTLKDEASVTLSPVNAKSPPSPVQTFLGALTAGVIALILYKFTTTIEASLSRQTISDCYQLAFNSFMDDSDIEGEATPSSSSNSSLGVKSTEDKSSE